MATPGGATLQSPLSSPGKLTRQQEKEQLSQLNGRLAVFMDRVKTLRQSNDALRKELDDAKVAAAREQADARKMYDQEVSDLRRVLDETARDKAKNQIVASKNEALANDLKAKLQQETEALVDAQRSLRVAQQDVAKKEGELKALEGDNKAMRRARKEAETELADAKKEAEISRGALDGETVARVNAENNLQSVREDMEFKEQLFAKERDDLYAKLAAKERDLDNTIADFQGRLDERHSRELDDLREQFDSDLTAQREELEKIAEEKYRQYMDRADRDRSQIKKLLAENQQLRDEAQKLHDMNTILDAKNGELQKRLDSAEKERQDERARHDRRRRELEEELAAVQDENNTYRRAYEDLLDAQTRVDNEIQTYSALMDMEMPKGQRRKRRRPAEEQEQSEVDIMISEVAGDGTYVRITNTSGKDIPFGSWKLEMGDVVYKFGNRYTLKGHSSVSVWSTESGQTHRPPKDIVAKSCKSWPVGDEVTCSLSMADGKVMHIVKGVSPEVIVDGPVDGHASPSDVVDGRSKQQQQRPLSKEDIFHQQGDPSLSENGKPDGGCIMS